MALWSKKSLTLPTEYTALPGREIAMAVPEKHFVNAHTMQPPWPEGYETVLLGLGCFWGAERKFWQLPGVYTTAVGYAGGITPNPTYEELCTGKTGHAEVVLVVYHPDEITFERLIRFFFENHDPTQGMQQGNDVGTQYRSVIYVDGQRQKQAQLISEQYQSRLQDSGHSGTITTEIAPTPVFYYAEPYHQQYLAKNPDGYCGIGGTGICF